MASTKQILARISAARTALEKAVAMADVMRGSSSGDDAGLDYIRNELIRVCGRLDSAAGVAENLIYRDAKPEAPRKRKRPEAKET